ncbi:type II toxin-antitoxin system RelE/ParE family toxin [Salmonella enterica]|uniref:Type II toxin-antitoxin system RelE/ParE family toxin n=3 Tax=Salmonella enterica TaxID=28901 RepID=A0A757Y5F2_SALER|nr:type II toxin-antitoxin system RelE/ParE family toxin [Salmonella enterica subsp. enterica serovar Koketime]EAB8207413.1 type II toxin-antitoxin system RelE/ParE family toxin [Salmonella enterica subsp. enterica serovar Lattenkamp]EAM8931795.1 type II toxin-antitoxin system RelE/ParE family toxin [Salmonella enterica]EBY0371925.1 type II toxin-antitoxin system RelE/ParE family toxin [Salmonella enterica subsp. enterica serovar Toulon]ECJ3922992.1 type II toxin-antitoxin system RelE/ParE fami
MKDDELSEAVNAVLQGKADNRGGGVYKKRLNQNRDRAIVLAKGGEHWFYTFLYAKQEVANIRYRELAGFREFAKHYACLTEDQITALINNKELVEMCHVSKNGHIQRL